HRRIGEVRQHALVRARAAERRDDVPVDERRIVYGDVRQDVEHGRRKAQALSHRERLQRRAGFLRAFFFSCMNDRIRPPIIATGPNPMSPKRLAVATGGLTGCAAPPADWITDVTAETAFCRVCA